MNATENRYYVQARREGMPAGSALRYARYMVSDDVFDWDGNHDKGTLQQDGFDLVATVSPDYDQDISYLGTFTDTRSDDAVRNPNWNGDSRTYQWFVPAITADEHVEGLVQLGYSHGVANETAWQYVKRDAARAVDVQQYVLTVTATRNGIELASSTLGGIDVSDDFVEAGRYIDDCAAEMVSEVIDQARDALASLCD